MNEMQDLKEEYRKLEIRIKEMESRIKKPLKKDLDANAIGERNREVLNKVYEIEKKNLARLESEINKHLV